MSDVSGYVGTWRAEKGAPFSTHTVTWENTEDGLRGRWIIEAADSPAARAAVAAGRPTRFEMQIGAPWLEDGLLLFHINGGPPITEFRLVGSNEAVLGASVSKLPPELAGPDHQRGIEGHRVQLTRQSETVAQLRPTLRQTTPVFLVADIESTMRWYSNVLGFDARPVPEFAPHSFCILTRDNITIFLQQLAGYSKPDLYERREGGVWSTYVQTQGVRELFRQLSQRDDVTVLKPLSHQPYGQTEFVIRDPNGYALVFAEPD